MEDKAALQPGSAQPSGTIGNPPPPPSYDAGQQAAAPYPAPQPMMAQEYHPAPARMYGQTATTSNVTVIQHQPYATDQVVEYGPKPNNYLALSVINMLCCCFILGVIALVYSLQVDTAWTGQRPLEARSSSNTAKVLNIIGFTIGIIAYAITAIAFIVIFATAAGTARTYNSYDSYNG